MVIHQVGMGASFQFSCYLLKLKFVSGDCTDTTPENSETEIYWP